MSTITLETLSEQINKQNLDLHNKIDKQGLGLHNKIDRLGLDLNSKIDTLANKVNTLSDTVDNLAGIMKRGFDQVYETIDMKFTEVNNSFNSIDSRFNKLDGEIGYTRESLLLMQKDVENMRDRLASIEEFIQSANRRIDTNTADISTLSSEFIKIKNLFQAFDTKFKQLTA